MSGFTVRSLLDDPAVKTRSLVPGVGEDRRISWAHVSELPDPWRWIGPDALVMTTGLAIPEGAAEQAAYYEGMHRAGIAAVTIGAQMSAPPLAESALAHAAEIGFPVLETAYEVPYIVLATAVAEAAERERTQRIRLTERMYGALRAHADADGVTPLLAELGEILGGEVSLGGRDERTGAEPGRIDRVDAGAGSGSGTATGSGSEAAAESGSGTGRRSYQTPLLTLGRPTLRFTFAGPGVPEPSLLQHAAGIVTSALSVQQAARHSEWMYGSILLANLIDGTVPLEFASEHLAARGIVAPLVMCVTASVVGGGTLEAAQLALATANVPSLMTIKDGQLVLLVGSSPDLALPLRAIAGRSGTVGVSAPFGGLGGVHGALSQAEIALAQAGDGAGVTHFGSAGAGSLFLPREPGQLRAIAGQVLGPLQVYERRRGTPLVQTLRVFLEENRSWVRAAERLFIHRQTLVARIARIEAVTGRDLNSMEDAAECWLAIRAAIAAGELDSGPGVGSGS